MHRPGTEPVISRSQVLRPTTTPPSHPPIILSIEWSTRFSAFVDFPLELFAGEWKSESDFLATSMHAKWHVWPISGVKEWDSSQWMISLAITHRSLHHLVRRTSCNSLIFLPVNYRTTVVRWRAVFSRLTINWKTRTSLFDVPPVHEWKSTRKVVLCECVPIEQ